MDYKDFRSLTQNIVESWYWSTLEKTYCSRKKCLKSFVVRTIFLLAIVINVGCQLVYNVEDNLFPSD